jgi:CRP/FNR family transcriptional regulator, cyclic AMP receptor protein
LVLAAFGMKDMVNLRIVAICSNVAFITYAVMLNLPPILILHVTLLPLNGWRLGQEVQRRVIQRPRGPTSPTKDSKSPRSPPNAAGSRHARPIRLIVLFDL